MAPTVYPKISTKAWRALRDRASAAPSAKFTPQNVAVFLGMETSRSAADNVVVPLRRLGLIDEDGSLTDRGRKWRVNEAYADACQEILDEVYPDELMALTDGSGAIDGQQVQVWFEHTGLGRSNAQKMAATFAMIAKKSLPEPSTSDGGRASGQRARSEKSADKQQKNVNRSSELKEAGDPGSEQKEIRTNRPNIHLDIQIHIPADASPEQIDQIFASMGKHLYDQ